MVKRNIIANYLGQGWSALVGLLFIPLYIRYLGMESYALIGLFTVMQAWLVLLDMGMTPTLTREMARFTSGGHTSQSIRDLLRTLETISGALALLVSLGVWAASGYLANDWLKAEALPLSVIAEAVSIIGLVAALRFVESIYRGSLMGLQRQVWYNAANALLSTLRYGGAAAVVAWLSPTVQAFFLWQAACSLASIAVFGARVYRTLPAPHSAPRFSHEALRGIWKFASGMMGITIMVILLTQLDKVLLSRLLALESFGYYMLAATVAGLVRQVAAPVTLAMYPRFVELSTSGNERELVDIYHQGAQLVTVLIAPAVLLFTFFGRGVVFAWSGNVTVALNTGPLLQALALGGFFNGLMYLPYQLQLAHGWTSLTFRSSLVAVLVLVPAIFLIVPRYGALGAAWIWVALNAGHFFVTMQLMYIKLIPAEKARWYVGDVLVPSLAAAAVMLLARAVRPETYDSRAHWLVFLVATGALAAASSVLCANRIRARLLRRR